MIDSYFRFKIHTAHTNTYIDDDVGLLHTDRDASHMIRLLDASMFLRCIQQQPQKAPMPFVTQAIETEGMCEEWKKRGGVFCVRVIPISIVMPSNEEMSVCVGVSVAVVFSVVLLLPTPLLLLLFYPLTVSRCCHKLIQFSIEHFWVTRSQPSS